MDEEAKIKALKWNQTRSPFARYVSTHFWVFDDFRVAVEAIVLLQNAQREILELRRLVAHDDAVRPHLENCHEIGDGEVRQFDGSSTATHRSSVDC